MFMHELLRNMPEPYDDHRQILAESRLMNDVLESFFSYMKTPDANISTFAVLVKECITSVMPWRAFLRYK